MQRASTAQVVGRGAPVIRRAVLRKIVSFAHRLLDGLVASTDAGTSSLGRIGPSDELFDHAHQRVRQTGTAPQTALDGRATDRRRASYWPAAADAPGASVRDHAHARWRKAARKTSGVVCRHYELGRDR